MVNVDTILQGSFGFVRHNIPVVAIWVLVYMVGGVVMGLGSQSMAEAQMELMANPEPGNFDLPPGFWMAALQLYIVMAVMMIVLFTAAFRANLQPERRQAAYLRLGMDELRVFGLLMIIFIGSWLAFVAGAIIVVLAGSALTVVLGGSQVALILSIMVLYIGAIGASVWLMVRLSTAAPLTVLRGRITIGEAWRLTRGRFWTLFGAYMVIVMLTIFAFSIPFWAVMGDYYKTLLLSAADPVAIQQATRDQMTAMAPGQPRWYAMLVLGGLLGGVSIALHGSMTAIATRELLAEADDRAAQAFSTSSG